MIRLLACACLCFLAASCGSTHTASNAHCHNRTACEQLIETALDQHALWPSGYPVIDGQRTSNEVGITFLDPSTRHRFVIVVAPPAPRPSVYGPNCPPSRRVTTGNERLICYSAFSSVANGFYLGGGLVYGVVIAPPLAVPGQLGSSAADPDRQLIEAVISRLD
jgi:hypothetical protein